MATTDNNERISAAQSDQATALSTIKDELVSKLDSLQKYSTNFNEYGAVSGLFENSREVVIKSVSDMSSKIAAIKFEAPSRPAGLSSLQPDKYKTHVYESIDLDGLENKLMDVVTISDNGVLKDLSGVNIGEGFQESLYNYQLEVDKRDLQYELDTLDGKWAADGYVLPPGELVHARMWLIARWDDKRTDRTRNIFSEIAKLAQQNVQWAYENGIKIESLHAEFAIKYSMIFKDIIDALIATYKVDAEMAIQKLEAQIKQVAAEVEVAKLNVDRDSAKAKIEIEQSISRVNAYIQDVGHVLSTNASIFNSRLDAAKNVANGYQNIFNAWGGRYTAIDFKGTK